MKRVHQTVLIASTLLASWIGMQAAHETGHVLGAWMTGGEVRKLVLDPLTISRTDLGKNPHPLVVVWAGPIFGMMFPLALLAGAASLRMPGTFVLRFFAGFCLIANGTYISIGSWNAIGDCGEMLRHGSQVWQLWLFGAVTIPGGFWLWHRQGTGFGFGAAGSQVGLGVTYVTLVASLLLLVLGLSIGVE